MDIIICAVSSDFFANMISVIELIVAVIALEAGGKKVSEWVAEFRSRRTEAAFGYYMNLVYFIMRMRPLIFNDDGCPLKTLYHLSPSTDFRKEAETLNAGIVEKLSNIAYECLQYLSSNNNQIPPFKEYNKRKKWKDSLKCLVGYLNQFYLIENGIYLPRLDTADGINKYYNELKELFMYFEDTIATVTDEIFRQGDTENGGTR